MRPCSKEKKSKDLLAADISGLFLPGDHSNKTQISAAVGLEDLCLGRKLGLAGGLDGPVKLRPMPLPVRQNIR